MKHTGRFLTVLLLLATAALGGCRGSKTSSDVWSPDGSMVARPDEVRSILTVTVSDKAGTVLHRWNTGASTVHRWSLSWLDNSRLLARTSDLGPRILVLRPDGTWQSEDPLRTLSPDGTLVAAVHWSDPAAKTVTLSFLEAHGDAGAAFNVLARFETNVVVSDLIDCVRWDGNDQVIMRGADGEHVWRRQSGQWQRLGQEEGG